MDFTYSKYLEHNPFKTRIDHSIYFSIYSRKRRLMVMMTAKIFENGGSQAVRLPKEYRFDVSEVSINKIGNIVLLSPKSDKWESVLQAIDMFSEDYLEEGRS